MSISVIEVLHGAIHNIKTGGFGIMIGIEQLENAIKQLEKNPNAEAKYEESAK